MCSNMSISFLCWDCRADCSSPRGESHDCRIEGKISSLNKVMWCTDVSLENLKNLRELIRELDVIC